LEIEIFEKDLKKIRHKKSVLPSPNASPIHYLRQFPIELPELCIGYFVILVVGIRTCDLGSYLSAYN
jgi:hypothetical protein